MPRVVVPIGVSILLAWPIWPWRSGHRAGASAGSVRWTRWPGSSRTAAGCLRGLHCLAFDRFVGAWIAREAERRRIPRWMTMPAPAATFLAGPVGRLIFLLLPQLLGAPWMVDETTAAPGPFRA
jgi:hypothetical protein